MRQKGEKVDLAVLVLNRINMEIEQLHSLFVKCGTVITDSRKIKGGELFFALKGENFDGNEYACKALDLGAEYAVVNSSLPFSEKYESRLIRVEDTLKTLKDLGCYHREHTFVNGKRLTVIGLTGTNGKTTTKELIRCVLSKKYNVTATEGNLNNDIGVPFSLLKINADTEIAVIEMGANHPDDILHLVNVCRPDYGLITNVGKAHLLGFGSYEGVKKAKGQLYDYIQKSGKAVFLNADDVVLSSMAAERKGMETIKYGMTLSSASILTSDSENPYLRILLPYNDKQIVINTHLVGKYNADNIMAAISIGTKFGVPILDSISAIENYIPSNNRSQMVKTAKNVLIVDAYNANPTSMTAALDNFSNIKGNKKAVLLGDMRELGKDSLTEHISVLKKLDSMPEQKIYLVGEEFCKALEVYKPKRQMMNFSDSEQLKSFLEEEKLDGYIVLIKGSRSIMMEKVIPVL